MAESSKAIIKKSDDFAAWYTQVIVRSEMIDYGDISGCYILRPLSYEIWEKIKEYVDHNIKSMGVKNSYFPLFVSQRALCQEKDHIEGFAPEVAWVTRAGNTNLAEPIAVRPTSETVMYPLYSKWIRSHRDLPLRLNQWANVVRWEFKDPVPFIRSREFLWQEGHTAFATKAEADKEVSQILDMYSDVYEKLLAVPVIKGTKSLKEKFAGADYTTTIEAFIPATGKAIQAATSHSLGQNFAKMFDISFESIDKDNKEKNYVWQNSWGLTTRSIGVMIMVHGDDKGLVLPPMVAPIQVVVIPIITSKTKDTVTNFMDNVVGKLVNTNLRMEIDDRENYTPGAKYNHWELRGVPIRVEIGPKDVEKNQITFVRRDTGVKNTCGVDKMCDVLNDLLQTIQHDMFRIATFERDACIVKVEHIETFGMIIGQNKMCLVKWCGEIVCEEKIKEKIGAKSLCIPHKQEKLNEDDKCFHCGIGKANVWALFGRSY